MKPTKAYRVFTFFNIIIMLFIVFITLYPFLYIVAQSFSSEAALYTGQVRLWPVGFNVETYEKILRDNYFWLSYKNTLVYTVGGTLLSMFLTTIFAYALSNRDLLGRKFFIYFAVFTMFFNGGIIPNFVLINALKMRNTIWAVIVPGCINTYNLLIMKTFFEGLPRELSEAAAIDGMNTYGVLTKIVIPLSKAVLATMVLFYAVGYWNSWFGPFIYLDARDKYPVALLLRNLVKGTTMAMNEYMGTDTGALTPISVRSATMVLSCLPILAVYPFIQKYFVKGVTLGSVKG